MTAPPTPDEMRVAEEIVTNWITRCDNLPEIRFEQSWVLLHIIAAALSTTAAQAEAQRAVCSEIQRIMATYREQKAELGYVDTPGGLEHMGDVWRLLAEWDDSLRAAALSTTAAQAEASGMRKAAAIARNFRDGNPEAWDSVATTGNRIAAAILASGLQTTPPAAPAEDKEND
jgi:hypothetical protein